MIEEIDGRASFPREIWFTSTVFRRWYGLQVSNLQQRGVSQKGGPNGTTHYNADEVLNKCGDLIYRKMKKKYETVNADTGTTEDLKSEETRQKIRKLQIENDEREGMLVSALEVEQTFTRGMRAVCDVLDGLPSQVKMENPEISQGVLDSVNRNLTKVRNKAASITLDEEQADESD